jgi:hypothetical protein
MWTKNNRPKIIVREPMEERISRFRRTLRDSAKKDKTKEQLAIIKDKAAIAALYLSLSSLLISIFTFYFNFLRLSDDLSVALAEVPLPHRASENEPYFVSGKTSFVLINSGNRASAIHKVYVLATLRTCRLVPGALEISPSSGQSVVDRALDALSQRRCPDDPDEISPSSAAADSRSRRSGNENNCFGSAFVHDSNLEPFVIKPGEIVTKEFTVDDTLLKFASDQSLCFEFQLITPDNYHYRTIVQAYKFEKNHLLTIQQEPQSLVQSTKWLSFWRIF